jgi:hypothetical protein
MGGKLTFRNAVDGVCHRDENGEELLWRPDMRVAIASFVALMLGYEGTALAQAANPSGIRVTPRSPECGVLNRPTIANPPHAVYCGEVPTAPNWSGAPTPTYEQKMQAAKRGFAALDLNHDGVISRKEWSVMQARLVAPVPHRGQVQLMCATNEQFKLMDRNHDGKITFAEWTANNFGKDRQPITGCY